MDDCNVNIKTIHPMLDFMNDPLEFVTELIDDFAIAHGCSTIDRYISIDKQERLEDFFGVKKSPEKIVNSRLKDIAEMETDKQLRLLGRAVECISQKKYDKQDIRGWTINETSETFFQLLIQWFNLSEALPVSNTYRQDGEDLIFWIFDFMWNFYYNCEGDEDNESIMIAFTEYVLSKLDYDREP